MHKSVRAGFRNNLCFVAMLIEIFAPVTLQMSENIAANFLFKAFFFLRAYSALLLLLLLPLGLGSTYCQHSRAMAEAMLQLPMCGTELTLQQGGR